MRTWLADIRNGKRMTQESVAEASNISRPFYNEIENGSKNPSVGSAKSIANVLEFDWTLFFAPECRETKQSG